MRHHAQICDPVGIQSIPLLRPPPFPFLPQPALQHRENVSALFVASLKAVGIILVVAMLVAPGAIAYLLTDRFERMLVIAAVVAIGSSAVGTIVSFHVDGATGPCIVLIQAFVFLLTFFFAPRRGVFALRRA